MKKEKSIEVSMKNFEKNLELGEKLNVSEFIDSQVLKMLREYCEHIEAPNLTDAILLGDNHIYRDTLKCVAKFIIANPSIRKDLEKLMTNKICLYSNLVGSNEIICTYCDELIFPAHVESKSTGCLVIKMDNPCLVKVITFSNNLSKDFNKENFE